MIYACPHCEMPVECSELTGTVRCPKCQGRFELSPAPPPPASPPRAPTVSRTPAFEASLRRSKKRTSLRWIGLIIGGLLFLAISVVALSVIAPRFGAVTGISNPYKKAVRQYLSDHVGGEIIELEWGKVEEQIGIRLTHRVGRSEMEAHFFFSPNTGARSQRPRDFFLHPLPDAYFSYRASDTHKAAVREYLSSEREELEWSRSAPIPSITLKYKIETPAFGKSQAIVDKFYFKPGSYQIFDFETVGP